MSGGRNWQRQSHRGRDSFEKQREGVGRAAEQLQKHFSAAEQLEIQNIIQVRSLSPEIQGQYVQTRLVKGENVPRYKKLFESLQIAVEPVPSSNRNYFVLRFQNPDHLPQLLERLAAASDKFHKEVKGKSKEEYWHEPSGGYVNKPFRDFVEVLKRPSGEYFEQARGIRSKLAAAGISVRGPARPDYSPPN